jgi:small subunit ribosomal protein S20
MPHTKSAKKALRQNIKRRERNKAVKKGIRTRVKKLAASLSAGSPEQRQADFIAAVKSIDKAAAKGVIHANAAARKKSQLAKKLNAATAPTAAK